MRGKTARELRKIAKFKPRDKREYRVWTFQKIGWIAQYNPETKTITPKQGEVDYYITECITGSRKVYKHLKKFYNGFVDEQQMNVLPNKEELDAITKQVQQDEELVAAMKAKLNQNKED